MSVIKEIIINNGSGSPISADIGGLANNIDYDGTSSGLSSTNVQDAIDEVISDNIEFIGTQAQWDALTPTQKAEYDGKTVIITDDYSDTSNAHIIVNNSGTEMNQRSKLKFAGGTVTDDNTNDVTIVSYSAADIGAIPTTAKGVASGVAELDVTGKVPSSQLPSYVDDVIEGYYNPADGKFYTTKVDTYTLVEPVGDENPSALGWYELDGSDYVLTADTDVEAGKDYYTYEGYFGEITGETGKIYVDKDTNSTYRWSGSVFVAVGSSLALGETSSTAYRGDRGKAAYDHSLVTTGNPHNVTKSDVGLGNVGNFKAVSTEASQGLSTTEKANAKANLDIDDMSPISNSFIDNLFD